MDSVLLTGADQQVVSRPVATRYYGFSLRETSSSSRAVVEVYDGTSASGELIETISLGAGESARESYSDPIILASGIFVDVVSGAVRGVVRVG